MIWDNYQRFLNAHNEAFARKDRPEDSGLQIMEPLENFKEGEKWYEFDGKGYGDFKMAVGEACADGLAPVQTEFKRLMADKAYLETIMRENADQASYIARKTLSKVYRKIGFIAK